MKKRILTFIMALSLSLGLMITASASGQTTVRAGTVEELQKALKSNTTIVLEGKDYNVGELGIFELENVTIQGTTGTRLLSPYLDDVVVYIRDSKNIVLDTLVIGHEKETEVTGCDSGVLNAGDSTFTVLNCDIFGCGMYGLDAYDCSITMKNSVIRDCSHNIMYLTRCAASFDNCTFSGNGYKEPETYGIKFSAADGAAVAFSNCTFTNNKNPQFLIDRTAERPASQPSYSLMGCTFTGNAWGTVNNTVAQPAAAPTASAVLVNGEKKSFDAYNIDGANYFKLRDLAYVLNGTEKQFEVSWDGKANAILLTSGAGYTADGSEMTTGAGKTQSAKATSSKILVDGAEVSLTAYNINNSNYFKLRDIGELFNFGVDWDNGSRTITIDTSKDYTPG